MAGHESDVDFRITELRRFGRQDQIARRGQSAAARQRASANRGDNRTWMMAHGSTNNSAMSRAVSMMLQHARFAALVAARLKIGAGTEVGAGAGDHYHPHIFSRAHRGNAILQFRDIRLRVQRIALFRAIQRDARHALLNTYTIF